MTQRINPLKQGYRQILVPATGVFWSTFRTPAIATPPPRVTVYVPDPRLGFWECQFRGMCLNGCSWQFCLYGAGRLFVHPAYTRGLLYIITSSSLKKRENSVGSWDIRNNEIILGQYFWWPFSFTRLRLRPKKKENIKTQVPHGLGHKYIN